MAFKQQFSEYTGALYDALDEDAFYRAMESSVSDQKNAKIAMLEYFDYSMQEAQEFGQLFIPENKHYGVSVWSKPLTKGLSALKCKAKRDFIQSEMGNDSLYTYERIVEFMSEKAEKLIDDSAWYLSIVGVMPQFQGQGMGSSLITPILKDADALNIPTYLETFTPGNVKFYEKLGYKIKGTFSEPTTQADYSILVREPNGQQSFYLG